MSLALLCQVNSKGEEGLRRAQEDLGQDVRVSHRLRCAIVDDLALVEDIGPVHDVQNTLDVVLDDKYRGTELFADLGDLLEDLFDYDGSEAEGRLVQEQDLGRRPRASICC